MPYTIPTLIEEGCPVLMDRLLQCVADRSSVTYGQVASDIEKQNPDFGNITPLQIGHVAGNLIREIWDFYPDAPPINALVVNATDGYPSEGVDSFLSEKGFSQDGFSELDDETRAVILRDVYEQIFSYPLWDEIAYEIYGIGTNNKRSNFQKGIRPGVSETRSHRALKDYIYQTPKKVNAQDFTYRKKEFKLPSGDSVDVAFMTRDWVVLCEVKSKTSDLNDHHRGIFQCLKYREVKSAEENMREQQKPRDVYCYLVLEGELNEENHKLANLLNIDVLNVA